MSEIDVKEAVRSTYSRAALRVNGQGDSCCGTPGARASSSPITADLYDNAQTDTLPEAAVLASLGCGNLTALAKLKPGEVVLDLALAAASTCCCRRAGSARARPMGST